MSPDGSEKPDAADRFNKAAKRAAPMLGVALVCYAASKLIDFSGAEFLANVSAVFLLLGLSGAVFALFDRS